MAIIMDVILPLLAIAIVLGTLFFFKRIFLDAKPVFPNEKVALKRDPTDEK